MKRLLVLLVLLALLLGGPYGLAKMGVIPVAKLTAKNPLLAKVARAIGLAPRPAAVQAEEKPAPDTSSSAEAPSPPPALSSRPAPPLTPPASPAPSQGDSAGRQVGWMAKVYEEMEPEQAVRILERLDDREVVALLRKMKQRQVAQILALLPPDRAARLSRSLMIQR